MLVALGLPVLANGFVVCRGADGHVAVEPAAPGHCESSGVSSAPGDATVVYTRSIESSTCTDIPLLSGVFGTHKPDSSLRINPGGLAGLPSLLPDGIAAIQTARHHIPLRRNPIPPPHLAHLRTIVLLV
jgi:hypothetical protein